MLISSRAALALTLVAALAGPASAQTRWSRTFGGSGTGELVLDAREAADGTFLVAATTDSFGTMTGDAWIVRLDGLGTILSEVVVGHALPGGASAAALEADGSVYIGGRNVRDPFTPHDGWVARVAADGTVLWSQQFVEDPGRFFVEDAALRPGGGVLFAGHASPIDAPPFDAWVLAYDAAGSLDWQRRHRDDTAEVVDALVATPDGEAVLAGWTTSRGAGGQDAWLARVDADGDITWQTVLGGTGEDSLADVTLLDDGSVAAVGVSSSYGSSGRSAWVVRVAGDGTFLWHAALFDTEWGDVSGVEATADGNFVVLGRISDAVSVVNELWAAKLAPTAPPTVLWQVAYAPDSGAWGEDVVELSDGGLLLAGTWDWGFSTEDLWVLRTDTEGQLGDCDLVRETTVVPTAPRISPVAGMAIDRAAPTVPADLPLESTVGASASTTQCFDDSCIPLSCVEIVVDPDPACAVDSVTLTASWTGGLAPIAVEWDFDSDGSVDATGNPASMPVSVGTRAVTARLTDSCSPRPQTCQMARDVVVHPDMTPTVTPDGPTSFCAMDGESVTLEADGGFAAYQWSRDGADLPGENAPSLAVTTSGGYTVTVVDGNGCTWTSDPIVVDAEACSDCPTITCDGITVEPPEACEGDEQTFTLATSGGEAPLTIEWDFDSDGMPDATGNPVVATLPAGTSTVSVTATDSCTSPSEQSCSLMTDVVVHPDRTPTIVPDGPTSFCAAGGESVTLDAGDGYTSYAWSRDGAVLPGETGSTLEAAITGSYVVEVVDANGCTWTSAPIAVDGDSCDCPPLVCDEILTEPLEGCEGGEMSLSLNLTGGEAPVTVEWDFDSDGTVDATGNPVFATLPPGTNVVTARAVDSCAEPMPQECELTRDVVVHADPDLVIAADGPTSFCAAEGESVTLSVDDTFLDYAWLRDGMVLSGETGSELVVTTSGAYVVRVIDDTGCTWSSAPIEVDAESCDGCPALECSIDLIDPNPACAGTEQRFVASATGGTPPFAFAWDFDGDGTDDAFGADVLATLPVGVHAVEVRVTDSCPTPVECTAGGEATVLSVEPPPEVSDVRAGAPALRVEERGTRLVFEELPDVRPVHVYVDAIGSWYFPEAATGTTCAQAPVSRGDGTTELAFDVPAGSWVVVTAATPCAEGPPGRDFADRPREATGTWEWCGPVP